MLPTEFEFRLDDKINYQVSGTSDNECWSLILKFPNKDQFSKFLNFKQLVAKNFFSLQSQFLNKEVNIKNNESSLSDNDNNDIKSLIKFILYAGDGDVENIFNSFEKLLFSGICVLSEDKNITLNKDLYKKISVRDSEKMLVEYCSNFLDLT